MNAPAWLLLWILGQAAPEAVSQAATAETLEQSFLAEQRALLASEDEKGRVAKNLRALTDHKRLVLEKVRALELEQGEMQDRLDEIARRQAELRTRLKARQKVAGDRLALLARRSVARPLELLLTASSPGDFVYRYHALRAIAAKERELIAEARQANEDLIASQLVLDHEMAQSQLLALQNRDELARLNALETLQQEQLALLDEEVEERRIWMDAIHEQARELGLMINRLQGTRKQTAKPASGDLVEGVRVAAFGDSDPRTGNLLPSDGWSFQAAEGTPVLAVAEGTVVFADWFQGYGYLVILDHGGGVSTLYAHLAETAVEKAVVVDAGQIVGAAGSTGSVTMPGVYFEVRRNGQPIDPASWMKRR
jgi:septal ring factor EnvC (AmiA/AmiB activator)